ncbi:Sodium channel protein 60E [Eumeta japonica]|uniref:Sodium channel protein 60E n=1 Tax=Eumeta variegata TaxID=151549 RepID=A0A4C1YV38_EUMVA|nr:Sodium channel protein 60E [Eumeta japonica]
MLVLKALPFRTTARPREIDIERGPFEQQRLIPSLTVLQSMKATGLSSKPGFPLYSHFRISSVGIMIVGIAWIDFVIPPEGVYAPRGNNAKEWCRTQSSRRRVVGGERRRARAGMADDDERRLSFPPPAPLHSPGEEIDGSRLLGEIVRTLEATNPEAAAPLAASQSRDALDSHCERPKRDELRIPLEGVTFSSETVGGGGAGSGGGNGGGSRDEPRAAVTPFTRESAKRAGSRGAQMVREFGFMPRRRLSVEDGARLPRKYEPFPPKLYGRPLEEIDNFIYDESIKWPSSSQIRKPEQVAEVAVESRQAATCCPPIPVTDMYTLIHIHTTEPLILSLYWELFAIAKLSLCLI